MKPLNRRHSDDINLAVVSFVITVERLSTPLVGVQDLRKRPFNASPHPLLKVLLYNIPNSATAT